MSENNKINEYLRNNQNPYVLQFEDMLIEMEYSENDRTFSESMVNILSKKLRTK